MRIILPEKVNVIINKLENAGFEAYAVGGCVRDSCLGRLPDDWDITTSARPSQVKELFAHTVDTGIEHGTVTVLLDKDSFEVTTYRIDGEYADGRHPLKVEYTPSLLEDLRRRDFTINAMAYNESAGLVDAFDGMKDLEKGIVRCVGIAKERFGEDALRMMRAVRFCAQLGFHLDEKTADAIRQMAGNLRMVSAERIRTELVKLLVSPRPEWIRLAWETGITAVVLPEFDRIMDQPQNNAHHIFSVGEYTMETMRAIRPDKILRLTMLFHDMGKPLIVRLDENGIYHFRGHAARSGLVVKEVMKRLKFDRDTSEKVYRLVIHHSLYPKDTPEGVRRSIFQVGPDLFSRFLEVKRADILGQSPAVQEDKLEYLDKLGRIYEEILKRGDCLSLKDLKISGKELLQDGLKPGKQVGEILNQLLDEVLAEPEKNEPAWLLKRSRELRGGS